MLAMTKPRRAWVAALMSLLQPGLGHLYAGSPRAALIAYAVNLCGFGLFLASWLLLPVAPWNILLGLVAFPLLYLAIAAHAGIVARMRGENYRLRAYNRWYVYAGFYTVCGILFYPVVQNWLQQDLEAFRIPSGGMDPTLRIGDYLYVAKWQSARVEVAHESVVVFESVEEPGLKIVQRIVGLPGDTIAIAAGALLRNGRTVTEPYAARTEHPRSESAEFRAKMRVWQMSFISAPDTAQYAPDLGEWGPLVVPNGSFFALGDNRNASYDSRYYGFIPLDNVIGLPIVIYLSLDHRATGSPLRKVRWERIGHRVQ
ncbi:MAG: signal peptidase I [Gemmatimonadales bacterium]|nr:signal peptidase I [Gemmatimonadales bacterium]